MSFKMRTSKPEAGNKYYIRKANGGYSNAILGNPTDPECNVLANCVGYAYGRFNEIGEYGCCKYLAPVNAENFMDYKGSCETGMTPKLGACMVWEGKGNLAGHVAIVERIDNANQVYTSESDYGGKAFFNMTRSNANGNWGLNNNFKFLGFIYNPAVPDEPIPTTKYKVGDVVNINGVYISSDSTKKLNPAVTRGTITKVLAGARNPYLLDNGNIGWVNDDCIVETTQVEYLNLSPTVSSWTVYKTNNYYDPDRASDILLKLNPRKFGGLSYKILADMGNYHFKIKTLNKGLGYIAGNPNKYPCTITTKPVYEVGDI